MANKALLIGVSEYKNKRAEADTGGIRVAQGVGGARTARKKPHALAEIGLQRTRLGAGVKMVDKGMPGAIADVEAMDTLLQGLGYSNVLLVGAVNTTRNAILGGIDAMFGAAKNQDRLVLYFSGHAGRAGSQGQLNDEPDYKDEVLCPSDTDWKHIYITDTEVMARAAQLPIGVKLEIILETCSASGMKDSQLTRRFGKRGAPVVPLRARLAGGTDLAPGGVLAEAGVPGFAALQEALQSKCVFWGASVEGTCSYSGPANPAGGGTAQGLFTRYFVDGYGAGKSRQALATFIKGQLDDYRGKHRTWHKAQGHGPDCMDLEQTPYVDYLDDKLAPKHRPFEW